jgi:hypothetical protein
LIDELRIVCGDGSYSKVLRQLARLDLLILDDFGLKPCTKMNVTTCWRSLRIATALARRFSPAGCRSIPGTLAYLNEPTVARNSRSGGQKLSL